ncbi:MAG: glycosyltransferase family protein [Wolinella sp.]
MKTLLFISDKDENFEHSFIENVINGFLKQHFNIYCVYFSDRFEISEGGMDEGRGGGWRICLPKNSRNMALELINDRFLSLEKVDFVIIRNFLDTLRNGLKYRKIYNYKLYFQLSFPHFYRSYHEARNRGKNIIFKWIKYKINLLIYRKLINQCDGFFPISKLMKDEFFPMLSVPYLSLPLGVNPKQIEAKSQTSLSNNSVKKFIYIGAIDINRNLEYFFKEFCYSKSDFYLEIYTKDYEYARSILPNDTRISLHHAVKKGDLFKIMQGFDVGIFYVPVNRLYNLCSPTKVMDYYACNLAVISAKVDECTKLFDANSIFFIDENIPKLVDKICAMSRDELKQMAKTGQKIILEHRNYSRMTDELMRFLTR